MDPELYWCLKEFEVKCKLSDGPWTVRQEFEYTAGNDGMPILTRDLYDQQHDEKPIRVASVTEVDFQDPPQLPDDREFTLSAFGLPEPIATQSNESDPKLVIPETEIEIQSIEAGQETEVTVQVQNLSNKPIRVIGLSTC